MSAPGSKPADAWIPHLAKVSAVHNKHGLSVFYFYSDLVLGTSGEKFHGPGSVSVEEWLLSDLRIFDVSEAKAM